MTITHHPNDRFPYEYDFIHFKIQEGCLPSSAEEYAGKLTTFFDGIYQSNLLFSSTHDITKVTLDDLNLHFERIKKNYALRTYNSIHGIVNQYYRFLIVAGHLPVPPLSWSISTQKIKQTPLLLMLPWEEMARDILERNFTEDQKLAFLLFSKGWSIPMMQKPNISKQLLRFEWTKSERDFLVYFPRPILGAEHLFLNGKGDPLPHRTLNKKLSSVLKSFNFPYKHGALRDDARIMYIANHQLTGMDLERLYGFVLEGRFSKTLLNLAQETRKIQMNRNNNYE